MLNQALTPWRFQPGEGPSMGVLCDCKTLPINRLQLYHSSFPTDIRLSDRQQWPGRSERYSRLLQDVIVMEL